MPNAMVGTSKERINQLGDFLPTKGRSMGRTEPQSLSYEVGVVRPLHTVNIRASLHAFCIIIIGTISAAPTWSARDKHRFHVSEIRRKNY